MEGRSVLENPTEVSVEEYQEILEQIRNEFEMEDCHQEIRDAARYNEIDTVRAILLCHGEDVVNDTDSRTGNTALHMAAANGHLGVVELLLKCGADPKIANAQGNTPLHWAATNGQQSVVDLLLKYKVDVLQQNKAGRSALTEGFTSENTGVVQSLLEHDSATEEKLIQNPTKGPDFIIHDLLMGDHCKIRTRELAIAQHDQDSILGQANPEDDTTGYGIWASSLVCAQWMVQLKERFTDKCILELGAGCGVPGITIASSSKCKNVLLTDFNPKTVENLCHNIELNDLQTVCKAQIINWSDPSTWPEEKVDFLIGADLIYQSDMVPLLVNAIEGLLAPSGRFLYASPPGGRQGLDTLFIALSRNFTIDKEEDAPPALMKNPFQSQDDDLCFLHFHELKSSNFILYEIKWR